MQIVEEAFPKIAATFVGLSVARLKACPVHTNLHRNTSTLHKCPGQLSARNKVRETLQGLTLNVSSADALMSYKHSIKLSDI